MTIPIVAIKTTQWRRYQLEDPMADSMQMKDPSVLPKQKLHRNILSGHQSYLCHQVHGPP